MNPRHSDPVTVAEFGEIYLQVRADLPQTPLRLVYLETERRVFETHGRRKFRNWVAARAAMCQHSKRQRLHLVNAQMA